MKFYLTKKFLIKGILLSILFSTQTLFGGEIEEKRNSFEDFYKTCILKGTESSALVLNGNYAPTPTNAPMTKLRAEGVLEKIDSVIVVNEIGKLKKEEFLYSNQGYLTKFTAFTYEKGAWSAWSSQEFEFDAKGQQTASIIYEGLIPGTSSWYLGQKYEYTYDENGFVSKTTISEMSNGPWIKTEVLELVNNKQGLVMEGIAYTWMNDVKIPSNKTIYNYDEDGDMTLNEQSKWENNAWVNTIKQVIIEDPDRQLFENYNWINGAWVGLNRQELRFLLTKDGKRGEPIYEALANVVNNQFRVFIEVRSTYNDDNLLILQETKSVDVDSNDTELQLFSRQAFTYGPVNEFEGFEEFKDIAVQRDGVLESFEHGSGVVALKSIVLYINEDVAARTTYLWNNTTKEWTGQTRATYVPGTESNPIFTNTDYGWHSGYKAWVPIVQAIETRVSSVGERKLREMIAKTYNSAHDTDKTVEPLVNVNKFTYDYGSDDVLIRQENFTWNRSTNRWIPKDGKEQEFDYNTSVDQIYGPTSLIRDPYYFKSKPLRIELLAADGNEFFAAETTIFHYSNVEGTNIPTMQANDDSKAYFVENTLIIETPSIETISIYALTGNLLFSGNKSEGNASFNLSLASGIYIIKGSSGWSKKLIK